MFRRRSGCESVQNETAAEADSRRKWRSVRRSQVGFQLPCSGVQAELGQLRVIDRRLDRLGRLGSQFRRARQIRDPRAIGRYWWREEGHLLLCSSVQEELGQLRAIARRAALLCAHLWNRRSSDCGGHRGQEASLLRRIVRRLVRECEQLSTPANLVLLNQGSCRLAREFKQLISPAERLGVRRQWWG